MELPQGNIDWLNSLNMNTPVWKSNSDDLYLMHGVYCGVTWLSKEVLKFLYSIRPGAVKRGIKPGIDHGDVPLWNNYPKWKCYCTSCTGLILPHYAFLIGLSTKAPADTIIDKWLEEKNVDIRYFLREYDGKSSI